MYLTSPINEKQKNTHTHTHTKRGGGALLALLMQAHSDGDSVALGMYRLPLCPPPWDSGSRQFLFVCSLESDERSQTSETETNGSYPSARCFDRKIKQRFCQGAYSANVFLLFLSLSLSLFLFTFFFLYSDNSLFSVLFSFFLSFLFFEWQSFYYMVVTIQLLLIVFAVDGDHNYDDEDDEEGEEKKRMHTDKSKR